MKTKRSMALCSLLALLLLSGCSLALDRNAASDRNGEGDQQIGVVVTKSPLDLGSDDRLYATIAKKAYTNDATGENVAAGDYMFAGIDGLSYFEPTVTSQSSQGPTQYFFVNEAFCVSDRSIHVNDVGGTNTVTSVSNGTLYVAPSADDIIYHINPVYQEASGDVYLVGGSGMCLGDGMSKGDAMSTNFSSSVSAVEDGKNVTKVCQMKISIKVLYSPKEVRVFEMGKDGQLIATKKYVAGQVPETFSPLRDTAFLIVETHYQDQTGAAGVSRKIYSKGADAISTFYERSDGCCVKNLTAIKW